MNCQRFEEVVNDIAREKILDASVRSAAVAHCRGCELCAIRLEDELAITHRLSNFAGSFHSEGAPARVKAQVLAAFELRAITEPTPAITSRQRHWISAVSAIAALVLIVLGLSIIRSRQVMPASQDPQAASVSNARRPASPVLSSSPPVSVTVRDDRKHGSSPSKRVVTIRPDGRNAKPAASQSKPINAGEIATDFLPLTYGGTANLADGGSMVRVKLPRSAMASFGLPVNMDRANEMVKADVLLGVDGLAHAIRFVR